MKKSILFGQNAVDATAASYGGWQGVLTGCVPDARDLAIATATMGYAAFCHFSGWNVAGKMLPWALTGQCTLDAWRKAHVTLQASAKAGDMFIFGNSGHGGQYDTKTTVNGGETMCFFDGLLYDTEFHELMKAWPEGVFVLYILDSCHSGGMDRDRVRAPIRSAPGFIRPWAKRDAVPMLPSDIKANVVQFCACMSEEVAEDGPQNGAFTGSLLAVWDQAASSNEHLTFQTWIDGTVDLMATCFPSQHPTVNVLGGGEALMELPL